MKKLTLLLVLLTSFAFSQKKSQTLSSATTLSRVGVPSKNLDTLFLLKTEPITGLIVESWKHKSKRKDTIKTPIFIFVNTLPQYAEVSKNNQIKNKTTGTH